jgi:2-polyprenyl-3-methyl-5-hydroxy-6-metoxy-1,4-benzoquinol methylase
MSDNARLLDFSCGRGDIVAACLKHMRGAQEIYATDFSQIYVDEVTSRFKNEPRVRGVQLTRSLPGPFPDGHFDVVIATEVIEHLLDHELTSLLTECQRLLKPGGGVFFTTPNKEDYGAAKVICPDCGCVFHRWQHVRTWNTEVLQATMEQAGFTSRLVQPIAWMSPVGKFITLLVQRKIAKDGLVYIGEKT